MSRIRDCCVMLVVLGLLAAAAPAATSDAGGGFATVDMSGIVTMGWADDVEGDGKGGWTDQGSGNDMREVQPGLRTLLGIPFRLIDPAANGGRAVLTLHSQHVTTGPRDAVLAVRAKARSLYVLHVSAYTNGHIATYRVAYADGATVDIPIRAGQETCDWWSLDHGPSYRAALHVGNAQRDELGMVAFAWNNPRPQDEIASITFHSEDGEGTMVIAAVTLSDKPAALPDAASIPPPDSRTADLTRMDMSQWFPLDSHPDDFSPTVIDQSDALDKPAGRHGWLKRDHGHLVFDDGVRPAFVGTSLVLPLDDPNTTHEQLAYAAHWAAKYGFTMIRLAFVGTWVDDPLAMDHLDFLVAELASRGIYTRFGLLWYRRLTADSGIDAFAQCLKAEGAVDDGKPPSVSTAGKTFFDAKIMASNIGIEKRFMAHGNPYRGGRAYRDDPAIALLEVTNEDSMFFYTVDKLAPHYRHELDDRWNEWLKAKYGTTAALRQAWGDDLWELEELEMGTVRRLDVSSLGNQQSAQRIPRASDQLHFYFDLNNRYFTATRQALRESGVKAPICGSGWFAPGMCYWADLCSNVPGMDYTDRHTYWSDGGFTWTIVDDEPFANAYIERNPDVMLALAGQRVIDMPFSLSEWGIILPTQWRAGAAPLMAFYGNALNGWDSTIHCGGIDLGMSSGHGTGFMEKLSQIYAVNTPDILCQYPALSVALRNRFVKEADPAYVRNLSAGKVLGGKPLPEPAIAHPELAHLAGAVGKAGVAFTASDEPDQAVDLSRYIDPAKGQIRAQTGELFWDYSAGYFTVDTAKIQGAVGFDQDRAIALGDISLRIANRYSSVLACAWDDRPLKESRKILVTAVARVRNTGMAYALTDRRLLSTGTAPMLIEGVAGTLSLKHAGKPTVTALDPYGHPTGPVEAVAEGGGIVIPLASRHHAVYYLIEFRE